MTDNLLADFGREPGGKPAPAEHPAIDRSRWGIFPDVDLAVYFGGLIPETTLSNSGIGKLLAETPLDFAFNNRQLNPDAEAVASSVAQVRGDVVGQLALGRGKGFAISPYDDYRTGDAKAWKADVERAGQVPIKRKEYDKAEEVAAVMRERLGEILGGADYQTEVAFLYQEMTSFGPIWVRGLMDVWCPDLNLIVDLKCSAMLYDATVGRHMYNMGWDRQAALYQRGVGEITGQAGRIRFADLMVKPEAPFTSRLVGLEKSDEYQAIKECQEAMETFGRCYYSGEWPGFSDTLERVPLPEWVRRAREKREAGEA
jgi:hypothetical protein